MTDASELWYVKHTILKNGLASDMCSKVDRRTMKLADCVPIIIHNDKVDFITAGANNYIKLLETRKAAQDMAAKEAQSKREQEDAVEKKKKDDDNVVKAGKEKEKGLKDKRKRLNGVAMAQIKLVREKVLEMFSTFMGSKLPAKEKDEKIDNMIKLIKEIKPAVENTGFSALQTNSAVSSLQSDIFKIITDSYSNNDTQSGDIMKQIKDYASKLTEAATKLTVGMTKDILSDVGLTDKLGEIMRSIDPSVVAVLEKETSTSTTLPSIYKDIPPIIDTITNLIEQYNNLVASSDTEE
jgi:hypothetical protein